MCPWKAGPVPIGTSNNINILLGSQEGPPRNCKAIHTVAVKHLIPPIYLICFWVARSGRASESGMTPSVIFLTDDQIRVGRARTSTPSTRSRELLLLSGECRAPLRAWSRWPRRTRQDRRQGQHRAGRCRLLPRRGRLGRAKPRAREMLAGRSAPCRSRTLASHFAPFENQTLRVLRGNSRRMPPIEA
jgi:hypothetical protein